MLKLGALVLFCLLSGVKRTWDFAAQMSANDPKRTLMALPVNQFLSVRCRVLSLGGEAMRRLLSRTRVAH